MEEKQIGRILEKSKDLQLMIISSFRKTMMNKEEMDLVVEDLAICQFYDIFYYFILFIFVLFFNQLNIFILIINTLLLYIKLIALNIQLILQLIINYRFKFKCHITQKFQEVLTNIQQRTYKYLTNPNPLQDYQLLS